MSGTRGSSRRKANSQKQVVPEDLDIELRLWNTFTYYTSRGNSQDPMHMRSETFGALCEEIGIVDGIKVIRQDCDVIYKSLVSKRADKHTGRGELGGGRYGKPSLSEKALQLQMTNDPAVRHRAVKKMHFSDFLTALGELAKRLYCDAGVNPDEGDEVSAFEKLIMEHIVLNPDCRHRENIYIELTEVQELYDLFQPAFRKILQYYGEFIGEEEKSVGDNEDLANRLTINKGMNSMTSNLTYTKWLQFCDDFNLRSSMSNTPILTAVELAEIFLQSVKARTVDYLGKLNCEEFWEAIVRCAQVAFRSYDASLTNKLKELFVIMSHKIDKSISNSINFTGMRDVSTNGAFIIEGMKVFQLKLNQIWRADGLPRSYLVKDVHTRSDGRDLLATLLEKQKRERKRQQRAKNGSGGHKRSGSSASMSPWLTSYYHDIEDEEDEGEGYRDEEGDVGDDEKTGDRTWKSKRRGSGQRTSPASASSGFGSSGRRSPTNRSYTALLQQQQRRRMQRRRARESPHTQRADAAEVPRLGAPPAPGSDKQLLLPDSPGAGAAPRGAGAPPPPPPPRSNPHWWAAIDPTTGRSYFYNRQTGERTWTLPSGVRPNDVRVNRRTHTS